MSTPDLGRPLARWVRVILLLAVWAASAAEGDAQPHGAADRMTVVSLGLEDTRLGAAITDERRRLDALCGSGYQLRSATCLSTNLRTVRERLSPLFGSPRAGAPVGYVVVRLIVSGDIEQVGFGFDLEWADRPGVYREWVSDLGDWGYGHYIDGWGVPQGEWVRLLGPPPLRAVWVPMRSDRFYVHADRMERHVVHLQSLRARPVEGGRWRTLSGQYTIVEVRGGSVLFRAEIPSDMPCGDDAPDPAPAPPVWTAPASAFFHLNGTPRFRTVYTRGC